jgi:hypothetical protein
VMMVGIVNPTGARAPGVGGAFHRMAVQYIASTDPTLSGSTLKHEGRRQTDRRSVYAWSRLKLMDASGRSRLNSQPSSRNGENPPCGMIGGTMETAASFEVRNAPSSYPTEARGETPPADSAKQTWARAASRAVRAQKGPIQLLHRDEAQGGRGTLTTCSVGAPQSSDSLTVRCQWGINARYCAFCAHPTSLVGAIAQHCSRASVQSAL